jgi:predicted Zn-dependent peptidase
VSHLAEHAIYLGTKAYPDRDLVSLTLDCLTVGHEALTVDEFFRHSFVCLPQCVDQLSALVGSLLGDPTFEADAVAREREVALAEIAEDFFDDELVDPDGLTARLLYPRHGLSLPTAGTPNTLRSLTVADLRAHHSRHYTAQNVVLTFSGALVVDEVRRLLERDFAKLPSGEPVILSPPTEAQHEPAFAYLGTGGEQTELRIALRAVPEGAPMGAAVEVLSRIIGDEDIVSSRLFRCLRGLGLYSFRLTFEAGFHHGALMFEASVPNDRVLVVTRQVLSIVEGLAGNGPHPLELELVRARVRIEAHLLTGDSLGLAEHYASALFYGGTESPAERAERLCAVTAEDVVAAARFVCRPKNLAVVAVGGLSDRQRGELEEAVRSWCPSFVRAAEERFIKAYKRVASWW